MKNVIFLIFILIVNCSWSNTVINITAPAENTDINPNVVTALSSAVDGDVLVFPSGTYYFDGNITTTKKVSLWGSVSGTKTILYRRESASDATVEGWLSFFTFNINSASDCGIVVRNIEFRSKLPSCSPDDALSLAADGALRFVNAYNFVVKFCEFYYFGYAGISVQHYDTQAGGLIAYNRFEKCKGYDGLGLGYGVVVTGADGTWVASPGFGSSNFIFIENNYFSEMRHAVASNTGSLYVARYNYLANNAIVGGASQIDSHEQEDGTYGSRAAEVYNNTITTTHFKIRQFADAAARAAAVPFNNGNDYGIQIDTEVLYVSNGTSAGNWTTASLPKGNHLGAPIEDGEDVSNVNNIAILLKGGESLVHNNTTTGSRFNTGIIVTNGYAGAYPVPYAPGWASGVALGSGHSGAAMPQGDGDLFEWDNNFTAYSGVGSSQSFWNFSTDYFTEGRDYHEETAKPSYVTYTYPSPLILK